MLATYVPPNMAGGRGGYAWHDLPCSRGPPERASWQQNLNPVRQTLSQR